MGKNIEFNNWLNGVKRRTRKKTVAGEGKNFQKGEEVSGARAAYGVTSGGARKAAQAREQENDRRYMRTQAAKQREVLSDPHKKAIQTGKNRHALQNIVNELANREGTDYGTIMDFAQDYIPTDNKLGKAVRDAKNRNAARNIIKKNR